MTRLDVALAARGLARSRSAAAALLADGRVRVDGSVETRAGRAVADDAVLEVDGDRFVGRAAVKLEAALDGFGIRVDGASALDVGASTGGFTQVLLERGARRVVALDVGHGQLAPSLRADPRVLVVEGENARHLTTARLAELTGGPEAPDLVTADLSFISLTQVLPALVRVASASARFVLLIKPQFEVGRAAVRGGIVHDAADRERAVERVVSAAEAEGLVPTGLMRSPVTGEHGNVEALVALSAASGTHPAEWRASVRQVVAAADGAAP